MNKKSNLKETLSSDLAISMLLFSIGFLWKLSFIYHRDICLDEPFTIFHAQQSIRHILSLPAQGEPNPPLFMLLLHFWIKLFGIGANSVRMLPLIFSSLTVVFIYLTGKRFFCVWTGLIASGMFLLSNFHFFHGLEVRTYALFSLATASSLYFYLLTIKNPGNVKILLALVLSNLALVYSHYFGWFIIFMQFIAGFLYLKDRRVIKSLLIAQGISFLVYFSYFLILFRQFLKSSQGTWIQPPGSNTDYLYQLQILLNHREAFQFVLWILATGLLFTIYKKSWKIIPNEILILFVWWFVPFTIMFLVSFKMPIFITRYLLFNSIGLYLFVAAAMVIMFNRHKYIVPVVGLILLAMMANRMRMLPDDFSYREVKNATSFVKENQRAEDVIILYPHWDEMGFTYYFNRSIFADTDNFSTRMAQNQIFPVWGLEMVRSITNKLTSGRIIYYLNGPLPGEDDGIFQYLSEQYRMVDSTFYPQTFTIAIFERK
jgi:uncharacterized membrane protein